MNKTGNMLIAVVRQECYFSACVVVREEPIFQKELKIYSQAKGHTEIKANVHPLKTKVSGPLKLRHPWSTERLQVGRGPLSI